MVEQDDDKLAREVSDLGCSVFFAAIFLVFAILLAAGRIASAIEGL